MDVWRILIWRRKTRERWMLLRMVCLRVLWDLLLSAVDGTRKKEEEEEEEEHDQPLP